MGKSVHSMKITSTNREKQVYASLLMVLKKFNKFLLTVNQYDAFGLT